MLSTGTGDAGDWTKFSQIALEVAREAAQLVISGFRGSFEIATKAHAELFTEYDLKSEQLVRDRLTARTPEIALVGEEQGGAASDGLTWYIDPIDGTVNFAAGHPWFCVSIGLMRGNVALAGAVVAPALGLEWWAARGGAAFRNGAPCQVSTTAQLSSALISTGYPCRRKEPPHDLLQIEAFQRVLRESREVRRCGSAAIELCLVADGTYDAYWMRSLPFWDTAAGRVIVEAAGGTFTRLEGSAGDQDVAGNESVVSQLALLVR
jgi:myo-inositol-1(or 4)-monophosphatase